MTLENEKPEKLGSDDELIGHNLDGAINFVARKNNCSRAEATEAVEKFLDFLIEYNKTTIKPPNWDEKSQFTPLDQSKHEIFEVGSGNQKKEIKMDFESQLIYAANVLQKKLDITLNEALEELKKQASLQLQQ